MSIGKPILVYSKEHQHVADYIQRNNAGLVARDNDELIENVRLLINPEIRNTLAKNGLKCVMENHSKKSAHDKLVYALNETRTKDDVN
jgi:spore maturation protein CgeB